MSRTVRLRADEHGLDAAPHTVDEDGNLITSTKRSTSERDGFGARAREACGSNGESQVALTARAHTGTPVWVCRLRLGLLRYVVPCSPSSRRVAAPDGVEVLESTSPCRRSAWLALVIAALGTFVWRRYGGSRDPARAHLVRQHGTRFLRLEADVEEVSGVPTELSRMLLDGEIDIAPIPSIEYARNADRLRILPRVCVSSEGAIDSIQLVTRMPFGQVRSVAVTPESATSVVLTRILLPKAEIVPLGMDADAKLLIGDAALRSAFEDPTPHFDLGKLWLERTGLPMVFAVWAAPEPVVDGLIELEHALVASVRLARSEPERLAQQASEAYGYPPGFLARYFEKLRDSFGPRERAGFYTFLEMARDVGELDHVPELRFARDLQGAARMSAGGSEGGAT